jgi:inhibitor of KinA sporulation pathway (predicted exonuclease)
MVAEGVIFNEACTVLRRDYNTQEPVWCSWGKFDRRIFQQQCRAFNVTFPFSQRHVNLKKLFAVLQHGQQAGRARQVGLMKAMIIAGLDFEGIPHRAGVDAYNTACLLGVMIERYGKAIIHA